MKTAQYWIQYIIFFVSDSIFAIINAFLGKNIYRHKRTRAEEDLYLHWLTDNLNNTELIKLLVFLKIPTSHLQKM